MDENNQNQDPSFYKHRNPHRGIMAGILLIVVGVVFLLNNYGLLHNSWAKLWPVFIIIPGIIVLLRPRR